MTTCVRACFLNCKNMKVFEKELSATERARHWVKVPSFSRDCFPPAHQQFHIKVGSRRRKVTIDSFNRLLGLGSIVFQDLSLDESGASVVIEKIMRKGSY